MSSTNDHVGDSLARTDGFSFAGWPQDRKGYLPRQYRAGVGDMKPQALSLETGLRRAQSGSL